jgi:hypothetical protein
MEHSPPGIVHTNRIPKVREKMVDSLDKEVMAYFMGHVGT